eukprot:gene20614-biopygen2587
MAARRRRTACTARAPRRKSSRGSAGCRSARSGGRTARRSDANQTKFPHSQTQLSGQAAFQIGTRHSGRRRRDDCWEADSHINRPRGSEKGIAVNTTCQKSNAFRTRAIGTKWQRWRLLASRLTE